MVTKPAQPLWKKALSYKHIPLWLPDVHAKSLQSCLTLCDLMDCSPPGFSVHGILQARILEWAAMPSSRGSFWPSDWTCVSCLLCWQTGSVPLAPPGKPLWVPYNHSNFTSSCSHKRDQNVCLHTDLYTNGHNSIFDTIPKLGTTQMTTSRWMDQQSSHQPISLLKNATTWRNLNYHSVQKGLLLLLNRFSRVRLCVTP